MRLIFAVLFLTLPLLRAEEPADARIRAILQERLDARKATGMVVGIVDQKGSRVVACGTTADSPESAKVDGNTIYEIGSITKAFTGILLAEAVRRNEVKLDDPVAKYLPATVKVPQRNGKQITLQSLSNHTSGLPRLPSNFRSADPANPYADYTVQQMYDFLSSCELTRDIGEKYEYSNFGAGLLGHVLALKVGIDFEPLVNERICLPLGMKDTRIRLTDADKKRLARPYTAALVETKNWDIPTLAGAGALRSTANDLLVFLAANAGLANSKIASTLEDSHAHRVKTVIPNTEIALGWHISQKNGKDIVWHSGGTGGYRTFIGFISKQIGVVVLSNSENSPDDIGFHLLDERSPLSKVRKTVTVEAKILERYLGSYELMPQFFLTISRQDTQLFGQATGQQPFPLAAVNDTDFVFDDAGITVSFPKGDGPAAELRFVQQGQAKTAKRVAASAAKQPWERPIAKVDPKIYDAYAGTFELAPGFSLTLTREGDALMAQATNQQKFEIFPESETKFFYKVVDAQIEFKKDAQGKVNELVLYQNGAQMPGKRK